MTISAADRAIIRELYGFCCGYCGVSEQDIGGDLQIDHYQPVTKGGRDNPDNLVYACTHCNRFKGNYWPDENSPTDLYLLHPQEDDMTAHFRLATNGRLDGTTSRGWFHIRHLHLNRPQLVIWRQNRQRNQALQSALDMAETTNQQLQQRIQILEKEVTLLRQRIARLTDQE